MENKELLPLLEEIKQQNMERFNEVYALFERLLICFCFRLGDDDAMQELTLFLLELIDSLDTGKFERDESQTVKRYIAVSLRNRYIALSRQRSNIRMMSNELYEGLAVNLPEAEQIELRQALKRLPDKERLVIAYRYFYGYSTQEIARRLCMTRQGVNRIKKRGLMMLKKQLRFQ